MGRKKRLKKEIEGIKKAISEHEKKSESYKGKDYALERYWEKEINRLEKVKKEKEKILKKTRD